MQVPPAEIGAPADAVDTPALVIELDAFERNMQRMTFAVRGAGVRLRPHAKSHKCPEIALRQVAAGAVGVCCQKTSEAEAMVDGGVRDVFVSNEVVGAAKLARLARLAQRARVSVCVDDAGNVAELERAARAAGAEIRVLVEINVGANRCGVEPGAPALALARAVAGAGHLRFAGLHAYHGAAQHLRKVSDRQAAIALATRKARAAKSLIESGGIPVETVTGAGTGTFPFEAASGVFNEIQPGSYVFMDADYGANEWTGFPEFEQSLFVLATVMSVPAADRAVVDAGLKASSVDSGLPQVAGRRGVEYVAASDEHGVLRIARGADAPRLGEKLRLVPGHCDPTVNLHDWIVGVRGGRVEALWSVAARGAGY
ncbi:MAG: DSD1 family PLP-dependent enzyme [Burkholderiales bacterium]|nr:DSD1 family PLP-dependent enzyme [Burkholderiales bacterium]